MNLIIETERLILRPLELSDAEKLIEIDCFPNGITVKSYSKSKSLEDCQNIIRNLLIDYEEFKIGRQAIILKEINELIGWAGIRYNPDFFGNSVEIYDFDSKIKKDYYNQNLVSDITQNCLINAFKDFKIETIYTKMINKESFEFEIFKNLNATNIGHYNKNEKNSNFFRITKDNFPSNL